MSKPRIVMITGGAAGIGLGIGEVFALNGDTVVVADLNEARASQAAAALNTLGGQNCLGIACDVANRASVQQAADAIEAKFGRIDVLINNAGI